MLALIVTLSLVSGSFASILCPTMFDPERTVHLPHPTDCTKFLTCVGTYPVEQACPTGLHWNGEKSQCDYPRAPRCTRGGISRPFDAVAVATSVCLPQSYQCPMNSDPSENVVFLKHRDCRKFYACVSTHQVELSCPPNLFWSSQGCVCDYEMEDDCDETMTRVEEVPEEPDQEQAEPSESDPSDNEAPKEESEDGAPEDAEQPESNAEAPEEEPENAEQEQAEQPNSESNGEAPEGDDAAEASGLVRRRRDTDSSSSSSNGTSSSSGSGSSGSSSSGSGSSGSGSSGSGSSGSGSSGSTSTSGATDIQTVSSIVMIVGTILMSTF